MGFDLARTRIVRRMPVVRIGVRFLLLVLVATSTTIAVTVVQNQKTREPDPRAELQEKLQRLEAARTEYEEEMVRIQRRLALPQTDENRMRDVRHLAELVASRVVEKTSCPVRPGELRRLQQAHSRE